MIRKWTRAQHDRLIDTARGVLAPTALIPEAQVLHVATGTVSRKNIWLCGDRIAYVGPDRPSDSAQTMIYTIRPDQVIVPGYIEPHAHPFQLYNPFTLGEFFTREGTAISINDNRMLAQHLSPEAQKTFIRELDETGGHLWLWWAYFEEHDPVKNDVLADWLAQPLVVQGGELSNWLAMRSGSADLYAKLCTVRRSGKRMEGHLPGSSANTLNLFAAAGITADHESMSADDVLKRLDLGYVAALRYSSIRPDLPKLIRALSRYPDLDRSRLMLTSDGASLPFLLQATPADLIQLAMKNGFSTTDAYRMATINPALYYHFDDAAGSVSPGRLAHLNVLDSLQDPHPADVLFSGKWIRRQGRSFPPPEDFSDRLNHYLGNRRFALPSAPPNLRETTTIGIDLVNNVITRPYTFSAEAPLSDHECRLIYLCPASKEYLSTRIRGFAVRLNALVSTYSVSGGIVLIGKNPAALNAAWKKLSAGFRGIAAESGDGSEAEIALDLLGMMSTKNIDKLAEEAATFTQNLQKDGFPYNDPYFCLLFLTVSVLPFIRLTPAGLIDVKTDHVLAPTRQLPF
ncbi:adenine deaminase C-terminal domain-containing protein [Sporolactobacillus vineae]|uniref:adenine deaminase C-terminal domain-containing protein n=1 Tax=Sporolactobacillus vineae TaxID=444463 RepID=UPI000288A881|nr:adenine deaminase C-terminal domain-containing protein [Sporolactobacillus vineae]